MDVRSSLVFSILWPIQEGWPNRLENYSQLHQPSRRSAAGPQRRAMAESGHADGLLAFFCARSIFQPFCTGQSQRRLSSAETGCSFGIEPAFSKRTGGAEDAVRRGRGSSRLVGCAYHKSVVEIFLLSSRLRCVYVRVQVPRIKVLILPVSIGKIICL